MLFIASQSGKFSLAVPFDHILSVGVIGFVVIVVCWARENDAKRQHSGRNKSFLIHAVEFKTETAALAMSQAFIAECEEVYKSKGVEQVMPPATSPTEQAAPAYSEPLIRSGLEAFIGKRPTHNLTTTPSDN